MAILDADPNKGAHRWATETYGGGNLTAYAEAETERLAELVPQLADPHDVLIADTAGFGNRSTVICIGAGGMACRRPSVRWPRSERVQRPVCRPIDWGLLAPLPVCDCGCREGPKGPIRLG